MKPGNLWPVVVVLLFMIALGAEAQKPASGKPVKKAAVKKTDRVKDSRKDPTRKNVVQKTPVQPPIDVAEDEKKVRSIVSVLEYMLNTLGSSTTSSRDKEVLVTESYSKIFRDAKVQIEDDLVGDRLVITNKDVTAYFKDVDFFFTDAKFEFAIDGITSGVNEDSKHFYKVALTRNLTGTTTDGQSINTTLPRFIEINYDLDAQDLKIVSIYTTEFSGKEALTSWWKQLSMEWQSIFRTKLALQDSVSQADIKSVTAIEELDVGRNSSITNIEPLSFLKSLKSLNLSHTNIHDLIPIRNLTALTELDLSHTGIQDLTPLKYSNNLLKLNISDTEVTDISVLEKMPKLQSLDLHATPVQDIAPLTGAIELTYLNISGTKVSILPPLERLIQLKDIKLSSTSIEDLTVLKDLKNLETLNIDSSLMRTLQPLSQLDNLKVLYANHTPVADLLPLQKLPKLERIYVDQTGVNKVEADAFKAVNPKVLVVYDSKDLQSWWDALAPEWQALLSKAANTATTPVKEELARVTHLDSINIAKSKVHDLEPLRKFLELKVIIAHHTDIKDLSPLTEHRQIRYLDISDTDVSEVSVLSRFAKLKTLKADNTKIGNLEGLSRLTDLKKIYVDETPIQDVNVREFLLKNPNCLVVYKTTKLNSWWGSVSREWKEVFRAQMMPDTTATRESLHKLVERESLHFKDVPVKDLSALNEFVRLKELHFSGTAITDLSLPFNIRLLKSLHATNSPLQKIESLQQLTSLEDLDISNTPIDDLKIIGGLRNLTQLNCAGTQIKKLDPLENLSNLEFLDCSNTRANNLDHLAGLPLKTLKCYNTKVSAREIEAFKKVKPGCNVVYYR